MIPIPRAIIHTKSVIIIQVGQTLLGQVWENGRSRPKYLIANIIEFIFARAETHAYYAIIGLIVASPVAILIKVDWSTFSVLSLLAGIVTFAAGWFVAARLGGE